MAIKLSSLATEFIKKQWVQIRGNAKWDWLKLGWYMIAPTIFAIFGFIRYGPAWQVFVFLALTAATALVLKFFNSKIGKIIATVFGIGAITVLGIGAYKYENARISSESPPKGTTTVNFNNSGPAFNVVGNNNSVGNTYNNYNYYITQAVTSLVSQATPSTALPIDLVSLTNQLWLSGISLTKSDFQNAYYHANEAIQIIENPHSDFGSFNINARTKAMTYFMAATSLDQLESEPQFAYTLAEKAFSFSKDPWIASTVAITSHNLSRYLAIEENEYPQALRLETNAISIYETNSEFLTKFLPPGSISEFYSGAAGLFANTGDFNNAKIYALRAYDMNPTDDHYKLLFFIFQKLGYHLAKFDNDMPPEFYKILLMKNGDPTDMFFVSTNGQIVPMSAGPHQIGNTTINILK